MKFSGIVKTVKYQKEQFVMLGVDLDKSIGNKGFNQYRQRVYDTVKGNIMEDPKLLVGQRVDFDGEIIEDKTYGNSIKFNTYKIHKSDDFFLRAVLKLNDAQINEIKKITPDWKKFFDQVSEGNKPAYEMLTKVKGIKAKKAEKIIVQWVEYKGISQALESLGGVGLTQNEIVKLHSVYKDQTESVLKDNPYKVTEVSMIGFKKADLIARKMGIGLTDPKRINACLYYVIDKQLEDGNTVFSLESLYKNFMEEIEFDPSMYSLKDFRITVDECQLIGEKHNDAVKESIENGSEKRTYMVNYPHVLNDDYLTSSKMKAIEESIFSTLSFLKDQKINGMPEKDVYTKIREIEAKTKQPFGDKQKEAILLAASGYPVVAVGGFAGSGKTTTSKGMLNIITEHERAIKQREIKVVGCAFSGVAANRIKKQSGYHAGTIHSLLEFDGINFNRNRSKPIDADVVILDEAGMVDSELFYRLMSAIDFKRTKLIMLGDPAQVPPVGAGQPFEDILKLKLTHSVTLDKVYRTAEGDMGTMIANKVRQNHFENEHTHNYSDYHFYDFDIYDKSMDKDEKRRQINEKVLIKLRELANHHKFKLDLTSKHSLQEYITYFQVITPMKGNELGSNNLNQELRAIFQANKPSLFKKPLSVGEKVIHTYNQNRPLLTNGSDISGQEQRIYNGQLGVVVSLNKEDNEAIVYFPNENQYVAYNENDVVNGILDYAYALTIHKTQGSEFKHVVMPVSFSHFVMLNSKLLYTGMTRKKEHLHILGEKSAFRYACVTEDGRQRSTYLQYKNDRLTPKKNTVPSQKM